MGSKIDDHAVVLGGSVAGMLAAHMLADAYDQVTVIERDDLAGESGPRAAIPQGHHIHALLGRGHQILEELFPGFTGELVALGVPTGDFGTSLSWYFNGKMIEKAETGLVCVAAGRPLIEERIRARVRALPDVVVRTRTDIVGLRASADHGRITGVRVQRRGDGADAGHGPEELIEADLVLDATGRGSRTPRWLEELGYSRAPEEKVQMDLTYTTMDFVGPLRNDPIGDDIALLPVATPEIPRGAIFARLADRYAVSLTGILGDRPPTDHEGFLSYVRSLPVPEIYEAVRDAEPMGPAMSLRFPASLRRRYERLGRFPAGFLVVGDAACLFNPVYGQGMTVAAIGATVLGRHLATGVAPEAGAYFRDLARVIDAPWDMSAGADLGFPEVRGRRTFKTWMGNAYIPRLQAAAANDPVLSRAFLRTAALVDPPQALMQPSVIGRVLFGPGARAATTASVGAAVTGPSVSPVPQVSEVPPAVQAETDRPAA